MDEEEVTVEKPIETTKVDVKIDETVFNELEQNMSELVETVKTKETNETLQMEKMDELLQKMIENEDAAAEKALLDEQAENEAKELAENEAAMLEVVDPDAIDLASLYKLLQEKMKTDAETVKNFDYLTCIPKEETEELEEIEGTEEAEEVLTLCNHLELNNEKLDVLIEQGQLVGFYGYIVIPAFLITFVSYKMLKWFT